MNEKYKFEKVNDRRGQPILGLWRRNNRFYFQTQLRGEKSPRKIPLKTENKVPVADVKEAQAAVETIRQGLRSGMFISKKCPSFEEYAKHYQKWVTQMEAKSDRTMEGERPLLKQWTLLLGSTPLDHITRQHLNAFAMKRKADGTGNRYINLGMIVLGSVLKLAISEGFLTRRVTDDWEALPYAAPKRELCNFSDLEKVYKEALRVDESGKPVYESGQTLVDYLKLMAFSGARRDSALAVEWADVNWNSRQLCLRKTKYSKITYVDFNANLETHLKDMQSRALKDAKFLFPSAVLKDSALTTLRATFEIVREKAGLPGFNFHDLRHYFISHCVMAGVDFLQIARWVGHADGGILIGRVYGHLTNEHGQRAAAKVSLVPETI